MEKLQKKESELLEQVGIALLKEYGMTKGEQYLRQLLDLIFPKKA